MCRRAFTRGFGITCKSKTCGVPVLTGPHHLRYGDNSWTPLGNSPLVVPALVQMLFQTTITFVVFFGSFWCLFVLTNVFLLCGTSAPRQSSPNTTENVVPQHQADQYPGPQLAKLFTQPWEIHDMTTVCETTRARINLDALGSTHFSTRTLLVGDYDEPNYLLCGQVWTLPTLFPVPLMPAFSSGSNSHTLGVTVIFIDNVFWKRSWRMKPVTLPFVSDAVQATFKDMALLLGSSRMCITLLLINDTNEFVILPFRKSTRFLNVLFRWICPHMLTMLTWFRFAPPHSHCRACQFFERCLYMGVGSDRNGTKCREARSHGMLQRSAQLSSVS